MTDFVIVVAAMAALASPAGAPRAAPAGTPAVVVPMNAPTLGFRTYPSLAACEGAARAATAPSATRLVCLPVEAQDGELASAY